MNPRDIAGERKKKKKKKRKETTGGVETHVRRSPRKRKWKK